MKKESLTLLFSLLAFSSLSANPFYLSHLSTNASNSFSADSPPPPDPQEATTQPKGMITPPVAPVVQDGADLILSADFIWWKTTIDGLEYAATGLADGFFVPRETSVTRGSLKSPKFKFQPGFKVCLGILLDHDGWDINAEYTWLNAETKKSSIHAKNQRGLTSDFETLFTEGVGFYGDLRSASSEFKHEFNVLDTELGRNFFVSRFLTLRPFVGLKFDWIKDKLDIIYKTIPFFNSRFDLHTKQEMQGVGIRAGLDTVWHFNRNWGIYGELAFSGLWSFIKTRARETQKTPTFSARTILMKENLQKIINVIEWGLGLTYMTWFQEDHYQFLIQAGWEEQVWVGYNNFIDVGILKRGNLNIHGLTVKVCFTF